MTVADMIKKLQEFDPNLPVALYDWQEEYYPPDEHCAESVRVMSNGFMRNGENQSDAEKNVGVEFVCIGYHRHGEF